MTSAVPEAKLAAGWRGDFAAASRVLSVTTLVGAACGVFVVGVLGRLAMMALAALNPAATGVTSDDGFVMGQFTLAGSVQLGLSGLQIGVVGAACYVAVRGLLTGPRWFRLVSVSVGPAVVIGAFVVHPDGVDFRILEPLWLCVVLFVALPAVYVALLHLLGERAIEGWRPHRALLVVGLVPWVVLFPVTAVLAGGFVAHRAMRHSTTGRALLASPWPAWILRVGLAVVFVVSLVNLRSDIVRLS